MAAARIAYVDDDLELRTVVSQFLEEEGYEVMLAADGDEGVGLILQERPDMVILDVMMPKQNGWEVAKSLRAHPELSDLPILMLTGIGATLNEMTAPLYGANAHLDKPFEFDELLDKVQKLLS
jgi:chemosensory pili system protein ChpA (sensor histidine kinase/response regulator)